jgi:phage I-like protein
MVKVGIREFRGKLASFLETSAPVAVTRHGQTIGFYVPARTKPAAAQLDAMIAAAGVTAEDLAKHFKTARRGTRRRR